jgi:hypothetical protein
MTQANGHDLVMVGTEWVVIGLCVFRFVKTGL